MHFIGVLSTVETHVFYCLSSASAEGRWGGGEEADQRGRSKIHSRMIYKQ